MPVAMVPAEALAVTAAAAVAAEVQLVHSAAGLTGRLLLATKQVEGCLPMHRRLRGLRRRTSQG